MRSILVDSSFAVLSAGPWGPNDFSSARVRILPRKSGVRIEVFADGEGPPIRFDALAYQLEGGLLWARTGRRDSWIFRMLD